MQTNYAAHQTLQFRVLSDRQIQQVYYASLDCLNRTGVKVMNAQARELLLAAGARLADDDLRVRIPAPIIQDAVAASPRTFTLWGRDPQYKMNMVQDRIHYGPGPSCTNFVDPHTGERRRSRRADVSLVARVVDALPNLDYIMGLAMPEDVHPDLAPVYEFAEMVSNSGKPIMAWAYTRDNIETIWEIAKAAGGEKNLREKPFFALFTTSMSPLTHTGPELENCFLAADHGIPIIYQGGGVAGSSSPVTAAGTLVVSLSAMLSGLAIIQLYKRGHPVSVGSVPTVMDLSTGRPTYGSPEMCLLHAAMSDICRYLELSFMGTAGASESKEVDLQAAIESTMQVVFSGLSGANTVHDIGMLDCADIGSLEMLIMNDEIISMTRRIMRGIEVSDETLMLDLIDQIGPGGEFMSSKHTARNCRQEIWTPHYLNRQPWETWQADGAPNMLDKIRQRLQVILKTHQPYPLPAGASEEIAAILAEAEERVISRHQARQVSLYT